MGRRSKDEAQQNVVVTYDNGTESTLGPYKTKTGQAGQMHAIMSATKGVKSSRVENNR